MEGPSKLQFILHLLWLIFLVLDIWILVYTFKLRKIHCSCAINWKLTYIQVILSMSILFLLFTIGNNVVKQSGGGLLSSMPKGLKVGFFVFTILFNIATIVNIGIVYSYIKQIEKDMCACAEDPAKEAMKYINYINIIIIFMFVSWMLISGIIYRFVLKDIIESKRALKALDTIPSKESVPIPALAPAQSLKTITSQASGSSKKSKKGKKSK